MIFNCADYAPDELSTLLLHASPNFPIPFNSQLDSNVCSAAESVLLPDMRVSYLGISRLDVLVDSRRTWTLLGYTCDLYGSHFYVHSRLAQLFWYPVFLWLWASLCITHTVCGEFLLSKAWKPKSLSALILIQYGCIASKLAPCMAVEQS